MAEAPMRAFRLTLKLDADSSTDLASALYNLAHRIECGKVSTGCWGGPTDGGIYELLADAEMTHEKYFDAVRVYLDERKAAQPEELQE